VTVAMSASRIEPKSVSQGKSRTLIQDNMEWTLLLSRERFFLAC
jgi:hypothetical protein